MKKFVAKYGWKTIVGTVLFTAGQAIKFYDPSMENVGELMEMIGGALGGVGLVSKFAKLDKRIDSKKEC